MFWVKQFTRHIFTIKRILMAIFALTPMYISNNIILFNSPWSTIKRKLTWDFFRASYRKHYIIENMFTTYTHTRDIEFYFSRGPLGFLQPFRRFRQTSNERNVLAFDSHIYIRTKTCVYNIIYRTIKSVDYQILFVLRVFFLKLVYGGPLNEKRKP